MNVRRLFGISLLLLAAVCFVGSGSFVSGQDKKKDETKKDESKKDEGKKKDEQKKEEAKKQEPVKEQAKPSGDAWQFKAFEPASKPFYQVQTTTTKQKIKVMGQEVTQDQSQTFVILWTPKPMKDKDWVVDQKIVGVKMNIDIGGNKISYDSTAPNNPKNPMTDFFNQLMREELTFTITPELKVKSIEGRQKFIKSLVDINPQMKGLLEAILSDEALTKMAEPTWWAFPKGGVIPAAKKWTEKSKLDLGPIGTYNTTFDFTYAGGEKIDIKTKLEYTAPSKKEGLPFIIKSANLKSDAGTGEAVFDKAKGRFSSTKLKMNLEGDLRIEVGNMETQVTLSQTQDASTTTEDANPWEKK